MANLKTNYKDRLLNASVNTERKFNLVDSGGNVIASGVSLRDITQYSQTGDTFGAADINKITAKINEQNNNLDWKLCQTATGSSSISLPSKFREILISVEYINNKWTVNIPYIDFSETTKTYYTGHDASGRNSAYSAIIINANIVELALSTVVWKAENVTSNCTISVYYR